MFTPLLEVCEADGVSTARIQGSCCPCRCLSNQQFQVEIIKQPEIKSLFLHVFRSACLLELFTRLSPTSVRTWAQYGRSGLASMITITWTMSILGWRVSCMSGKCDFQLLVKWFSKFLCQDQYLLI